MRGYPPIDRFLAKFTIDEATGCWLWTAARNADGYANFKVNGTMVGAHRWYYLETVGPIPDGYQLDHLCRVRHCVNPAHLEPVTPRENILRGNTLQAANVRKTHCPKGHPYDSVDPRNGGRRCSVCVSEQRKIIKRRYREKNLLKVREQDAAAARRRRARRKAEQRRP